MGTRLTFVLALSLAFAGGVAVGLAGAQTAPRMSTGTILDLVTEEIPRRAHVRVNLNDWEPGAETGRHTHPGPTVFVMLEGELEETHANGTTRTLRAGQAFWKPLHTDHNVRNTSTRAARALAVHLDPAAR